MSEKTAQTHQEEHYHQNNQPRSLQSAQTRLGEVQTQIAAINLELAQKAASVPRGKETEFHKWHRQTSQSLARLKTQQSFLVSWLKDAEGNLARIDYQLGLSNRMNLFIAEHQVLYSSRVPPLDTIVAANRQDAILTSIRALENWSLRNEAEAIRNGISKSIWENIRKPINVHIRSLHDEMKCVRRWSQSNGSLFSPNARFSPVAIDRTSFLLSLIDRAERERGKSLCQNQSERDMLEQIQIDCSTKLANPSRP